MRRTTHIGAGAVAVAVVLAPLALGAVEPSCREGGAPIHRGLVRDIDGNSYRPVPVGSQVWLGENLRATRTPEGIPLTTFSPNSEPRHVALFGRLYGWDAARRACPSGWHLPSDGEWSALETYLGANAGLLLRDPEFWPREEATAAAARLGFRARPAGYSNDQGFETYFGTRATFWTATTQDTHFAWSRVIGGASPSLRRAPQHPQYGFSVRCLSDESPPGQVPGSRMKPRSLALCQRGSHLDGIPSSEKEAGMRRPMVLGSLLMALGASPGSGASPSGAEAIRPYVGAGGPGSPRVTADLRDSATDLMKALRRNPGLR